MKEQIRTMELTWNKNVTKYDAVIEEMLDAAMTPEPELGMEM